MQIHSRLTAGLRAVSAHRHSGLAAGSLRDRSRVHFYHAQIAAIGDQARGQESNPGKSLHGQPALLMLGLFECARARGCRRQRRGRRCRRRSPGRRGLCCRATHRAAGQYASRGSCRLQWRCERCCSRRRRASIHVAGATAATRLPPIHAAAATAIRHGRLLSDAASMIADRVHCNIAAFAAQSACGVGSFNTSGYARTRICPLQISMSVTFTMYIAARWPLMQLIAGGL